MITPIGKWNILIVALVVIVVVIIVSFYVSEDGKILIPMVAEHENSVVYTTDLSFDKNILIEDCSARGGEFNSCGTPCGPEEVVCTAVCAYTCDLK